MAASDGVLRGGAFDGPIGIVPGEGAASFLLTREGTCDRRIGSIRWDEPSQGTPDLVVLDHDGLWSDGARYPDALRDVPTACHNGLWGSFPCGTGMALAAGLALFSGARPPRSILCHTHRPGVPGLMVTP
jgi:hypothetical protein